MKTQNNVRTTITPPRLWLTMEQRRAQARKNIDALKNQLGAADWQQIFQETVSYNNVIVKTQLGE